MQINKINFNTPYNKTYNRKLISDKKTETLSLYSKPDYFKSQQALSFTGVLPYNFFAHIHTDPLKVFKNFTKEEYLQLSANQINTLRSEFNTLVMNNPSKLKSIGELHAYIAECVETALNFEFGENNYVILLIGRSLSSICKSLATKLGEENVINIPMSRAKRYFNPYATNYQKNYKFIFEKIKDDEGLETFLEYLKSKNLSRDVVEKSNKQYVLMDYCISGDSLKGAEHLFKSDLVWGHRNRNIHTADIFNILELFDETTLSHPLILNSNTKSISNIVEDILWHTGFKEYATIGASSELKNTINAANAILNDTDIPREKQLVWFNLIDTIMSNKGNFNAKFKRDVLNSYLTDPIYRDRKIKIWNTPDSQYKNDLRDDLNELCNLLIKSSSKELRQKNNTSIKELCKFYRLLTKYLTLSANEKYRGNYYKKHSEIIQMLNRINENSNTLIE